MSHVTIEQLTKRFGQATAVADFSLTIAEGEFLTLLGPSGCGKSTVLRMVAGFTLPDAGQIRIGNRDVTHIPARERGVGMVFQSYALFPNMTAAENIAFGLQMKRLDAKEIDVRVHQVLETVNLVDHAHKYPRQLSGGMQQRVALARAVVLRPPVLLLDEPLSALDAQIRVQLRELIKDLQVRLGVTTLYVTHDQEEALSLSDRVAVMEEGRIVQVGNPTEIYHRPQTRFVAGFVGTLNFLPADLAPGRAVRPESIMLFRQGADAAPTGLRLSGIVERVTMLGALTRVRVRAGDHELVVDQLNAEPTDWRKGESVELVIPTSAMFDVAR